MSERDERLIDLPVWAVRQLCDAVFSPDTTPEQMEQYLLIQCTTRDEIDAAKLVRERIAEMEGGDE
jgi:hypothetical protein